jgi:hypothetical protein
MTMITCVMAADPGIYEPMPREHLRRGDPQTVGTASWLIAHQPEVAYHAGRELFLRHFSPRDGASPPAEAPVLSSAKPARLDFAPSCLQCHNTPYGHPGAGATIMRDNGVLRSTPHLYGVGLIDQAAAAIGTRLLRDADRNGDGVIERSEGVGRATVSTGSAPEAPRIDFGSYADLDGDGHPDLDPALVVWFVDADGRRHGGADLRDQAVVGYVFALRAFGSDRAPHGIGGTTLRAAIVGAFALHAGVQACDDALLQELGGWSGTGVLGVRQVWAGVPPDPGLRRDTDGFSVDDPDRDGICCELATGDVDLVEWYLANHPAPVETLTGPGVSDGKARFLTLGCAACHVPDWRFAGVVDRRMVGGDGKVPRSTATELAVIGVYSDFASHDLGAGFHERQPDGSIRRRFRTTPLWGVGDSAPYGHDGASRDLDAVIRRHGGEAQASRAAYTALGEDERRRVLDFLHALTLADGSTHGPEP